MKSFLMPNVCFRLPCLSHCAENERRYFFGKNMHYPCFRRGTREQQFSFNYLSESLNLYLTRISRFNFKRAVLFAVYYFSFTVHIRVLRRIVLNDF